MSKITLQSIETTVGDIFSKAVQFFHTALAGATAAADAVNAAVNDLEPIVAGAIPQYAAGAAAVKALVNELDGLLDTAQKDAQGGVTVTLSEEIVSAYTAAKAALIKFENAL